LLNLNQNPKPSPPSREAAEGVGRKKMAESAEEKFIIDDQKCDSCGKKNRLIIAVQDQNLSERYKDLLQNAGIRAVKKGETITCQNCGHKIEVK